MRKILAFLVLAAFLPVMVSAQEIDPYYDEYWDDWVWEDEGFVITEAAPPRRLRDDGPVAVAVISAEEIQNSTAVTLVDVLADHGMVLGDTGHHAGEHSGERIVMQGVDGGNVTILINGRRVAGRTGENVIAATLPLSNVYRIEVIRGPQSVRYGTAVGGVINIITREPDDRVTVSASFTNRFLLPHDNPDSDSPPVDTFDPAREQNLNIAVGFPIGRSRNVVDVEASRGSFHFAGDGVTSLLPRYSRGRVGFASILPLTDDVDLSYGLSFMMLRSEHQVAQAPYLGAPSSSPPGTFGPPNPNAGRLDFINRRDYMRFDANVGINWFVSDEVELFFDVSNSYYHREFDRFRFFGHPDPTPPTPGTPAASVTPSDPGPIGRWRDETITARENHTTANVEGSWLFRPTLRFTGGVEGQWAVVESERFDGDTIYWQNYEMFVEVEHFVSGRYSVALGVRAMYNPRFDPMAVPRLSGAVHLGRGFRLLGGVGMGYRIPSFIHLYSVLTPGFLGIGYGGQVLGDPDLRPETSVGTNLGLEWTGTRAFIHVNAFHTELWDQIDLPAIGFPAYGSPNHQPGFPVTGTYRAPRNLNRTFRNGVDVETRVNLPLHMFVTVGYSYVFAFDRDAGEEITLSPPHAIRGRLGIDLPSPDLTANVNFRWTSSFSSFGGRPPYTINAAGVQTFTPNPEDFRSTFTMGLFAAYRLNENWRVTAAADNILGTGRHASRPTSGHGDRLPTTFSMGIGFTN